MKFRFTIVLLFCVVPVPVLIWERRIRLIGDRQLLTAAMADGQTRLRKKAEEWLAQERSKSKNS